MISAIPTSAYSAARSPRPNIDQLAANGAVLTSYYSAPICAPTRAELLSGTDHHRAGEGLMQIHVTGRPGYEGYLSHRVVSLATRLRDVGYRTFMAGKWHLGTADDQIPAARGFDRSFALLDGGGSHYADQVGVIDGSRARYRDGDQVVDRLPEDFYSSDYFTDKIIEYLDAQQDDTLPFFAYLAYTAPHWPIQAPAEDVARQKGKYDAGYEVLRQQRFDAWKALNFASQSVQLPHLPDDYVRWNSLTVEEQASSSRTMEVYAAMVERMDAQIGRVMDYLRTSGRLDNTIVVFQSDNGAEGSSGQPAFTKGDNRLEHIGKPGSWAYLGPGWAEAGAAPFYLRKSFTAEGGHRVPAIVSAPGLGLTPGRNDAILATYDIAPTFLELAGADIDAYAEQEGVIPITGRSFAALIKGEDFTGARGPDVAIGREHGGHGSIRKGDWKLLWVGEDDFYMGVERPGPPPISGVPMEQARFDRGTPAGTPIGTGGPWQLFNLADDPSERNDVAAMHPEIVEDLLGAWGDYVRECGVLVKSGEGELEE